MTTDSKIFLERFNTHFSRIDEALCRVFSSRVPLIDSIGNHSLLGEGKRLRPLLFILTCQACGYEGEDPYRFSAIFEYIHTASLLHDDVIDDGHIRRKKPSVNHVWGNSAAVLGGDFLYSKSFAIAVGSGNLEFLRVLTDTTTRMAEGQVLELVHTHNWNMTQDEYMEIIASKTASLISAACACGAIFSSAEKQAVDHLAQFGFNMGIAFQLVDDLLDYTSTTEVFGKPVGKDLREGRITLPLIYILSHLQEAETERLENLFKNHKASEKDYEELFALVKENGVMDRIRSEAREYVEKAADFLDFFPESPVRRDLLGLNAYIIDRSF
ncbi:MAG: polyprenyl synthetase family protein [Deltaproteobacteria bacterium]|nr:polyprenyl synthetase family protein [Deltaproteobacteria bacterium]